MANLVGSKNKKHSISINAQASHEKNVTANARNWITDSEYNVRAVGAKDVAMKPPALWKDVSVAVEPIVFLARCIILKTRQGIRDNISLPGNILRCKLDVVSHRHNDEFPDQIHDSDVFGRM